MSCSYFVAPAGLSCKVGPPLFVRLSWRCLIRSSVFWRSATLLSSLCLWWVSRGPGCRHTFENECRVGTCQAADSYTPKPDPAAPLSAQKNSFSPSLLPSLNLFTFFSGKQWVKVLPAYQLRQQIALLLFPESSGSSRPLWLDGGSQDKGETPVFVLHCDVIVSLMADFS